jgi:hypothetical protein
MFRLYKENKEFLQECIIKALGQDELIVEWVDSSGMKFGKILGIDQIFSMQKKKHSNHSVTGFIFVFCFFVCSIIFTICVSERFQTLKEVF